MMDPMSQVATAPEAVSAGHVGLAKPQPVDPAEARSFASLMNGGPSAGRNEPVVRTSEPAALERALLAQSAEFAEGFEALDRSRQALASGGVSDPLMNMWRAVDFSFQSTTLFTRLHIATGLSTAVSNSFNSLLKSQQ